MKRFVAITFICLSVCGCSKATDPVTDTKKPDIKITSPLDGSTLPNGAITIRAVADDNVGIFTVYFTGNGKMLSCNGDKATDYEKWICPCTLAPGDWTLCAYALDDARNENHACVYIGVY